MTVQVCAIVEGDGEVLALPVLLRRMAAWLTPECNVAINPPIRVPRMTLLNRDNEFSRHLQLAASKCGEKGWILILLDADDDCPVTLGAKLKLRAASVVSHRPVAVVIANREFEAWFIASAVSLNGHRGLVIQPEDGEVDAESPRDAKGWLGRRQGNRRYHEISDQPAFAAKFDLDIARKRSRSFRKLCDDWIHHIGEFCPDVKAMRNSGSAP